MLLINTVTIRLEARKDNTEYAILSHRWKDGGEVLFAEMSVDGEDPKAVRTRDAYLRATKPSGWAKIEGTCKQARRDKIDYVWIDTCCIDKRSSAVESEEINSMYRYYQEAKVCYAYLAGLPSQKEPSFDAALGAHEWFTRGWTLQELIAPRHVNFFTDRCLPGGDVDNTDWVFLGNKKIDLCERLSRITGIDVDILQYTRDIHSVSVAKRMSWAAKRTTFKDEDRAYSLIGLFNVNMPLIYGEGGKAFIRLQEEIMKESSDESLFAWRDPQAHPASRSGLLATSPALFAESGRFFGYYDWEPRNPFFKTNHGLRITLPLRAMHPEGTHGGKTMAALNCPAPGRTDGFAGLLLERVTVYENVDQAGKFYEQYVRAELANIFTLNTAQERGNMTTLYVRSSAPPPPVYPNHVLQLNRGPEPGSGYRLYATIGVKSTTFLQLKSWSWIPKGLVSAFTIHKEPGTRLAAVLAFTRPDHTMFTMLLGSLNDLGDLSVVLLNNYTEKSFAEWARDFQESIRINGPRPCRKGLIVTCDLGLHIVRVIVEERIVQNTKYFTVSVVVEEHSILRGGATSPDVLSEREKARGRGLNLSLRSGMGSVRK